MKSRYILLAGMVAMTCLVGCSDDSQDNGMAKNPVKIGDEILFGSSLSDKVESRTVYGDRDYEGVAVNWVEGDEIAIFCKETSQPANHLVNYRITPDENTPSKASEVMKVDPNAAGLQWGSEDLHHFYAFYPASAVHGAESDDQQGTISARIPVNQQPAGWRTGPIVSQDESVNGRTTTFALPNMDYAYMYAYNAVDKKTVESGSGTIWLQFHNLVTVLDITIPAPEDGSDVIVTDVTVRAVDGSNTVLTGDFECYIRGAGETTTPACEPVGDKGQVRNVVNIPCYDQKTGEFITLGDDEDFLNVKAYIIPDNVNDAIQPRTLQISVSTLNGGEKKRTLATASIVPHKINRVLLPAVDSDGDKYWLSNLDPNIYLSELSVPGSKFSVLTKANKADIVYQNHTIEEQFADGVRAFLVQTGCVAKYNHVPVWAGLGCEEDDETFKSGELYVAVDNKRLTMTFGDFLKGIKESIDNANAPDINGKTHSEFAFVNVTFRNGASESRCDDPAIGEGYHDNYEAWMKTIEYKLKQYAADESYGIYTGQITPNTTLADVAGKIVLRVEYNTGQDKHIAAGANLPALFQWWNGPYQENGIELRWGAPQGDASLWTYYQEVTTVSKNNTPNYAEATKNDKIKWIEYLFTKSVDMYKNDKAHKTWFMNDLGGYYKENKSTTELATEMNKVAVDELQKRTENAGLGLIYMNFADKNANSGVLYGSDYLIQTIIMNNRKFQLRKKGDSEGGEGTKSYDASYNNGGNAIGWDK